MDPVSTDLLTWIASELSLTCLREAASGPASGEAPIAERVAALARCDVVHIESLLERARDGEPSALEVHREDGQTSRVLAWVDTEQVHVLFAPRSDPAALLRRAAAAERAAGVTHEVANSLTAIAGWTRMAATATPLPDRTRRALDVVQRSARQALGLARGLLRTMRDDQESAIAPSVPERTDAAEIVREVCETLRPEVEAAGARLDITLPGRLWGTAPPSALRLIISNLVRNAFEALPEGGAIEVCADVEAERFAVCVIDDGPGMPTQTLERAFERYFTTKDSGTGLGLAMVRDTVEELGGRVEVESSEGVGTRFEVWLPKAGSAPLSFRPPKVVGRPANSSGVHQRPMLAHRTILVVDDDETIRSLVRTALELVGMEVCVASDRESALALVENRRFDVGLFDLKLGEDRGDLLLAELRARGALEHAILMTGSASVELAPGDEPDALLRKPFELEELHRVIERVSPAELAADG